jgi:hypothetical protein
MIPISISLSAARSVSMVRPGGAKSMTIALDPVAIVVS